MVPTESRPSAAWHSIIALSEGEQALCWTRRNGKLLGSWASAKPCPEVRHEIAGAMGESRRLLFPSPWSMSMDDTDSRIPPISAGEQKPSAYLLWSSHSRKTAVYGDGMEVAFLVSSQHALSAHLLISLSFSTYCHLHGNMLHGL